MENSFAFLASVLENITLWLLIILADRQNKQYKFGGCVFVLIIALTTTAINNYNIPYHFVILITLMFLIIKIMTGRSWVGVISDVIIANAVFLAYQLIISIAVKLIIGNILELKFVLISFLVLGILLAILMNKSFKLNSWLEKYYRPNREIILLALINIAMLCAFIVHIFDDKSFLFWDSQMEFFLLTVAFVTANVLLMIITYKYASRKKQLRQGNEYAEFLTDLTEELAAREHEHKNHIAAIIAMASYGDDSSKERICQYCEQLLENHSHYKKAGIITDNVNIAAFIKYKMKQAEEKGISIECYIEKPYPNYHIPDYDMIELLANLINNAVEALEDSLPEGAASKNTAMKADMLESEQIEEKKVYLMMDSETIRVKNKVSTDNDVQTASGKGYGKYSTKGQGRGYGMNNIRNICNRYGIGHQIILNKGDFITELTIPEKEPPDHD